MTTGFANEAAAYRAHRQAREREASQTAAFYLISGIDLADALAARGSERERIVGRIERLLRRERHRGACRHWSYDLNRHIALKQALDRLRAAEPLRHATPVRVSA